MFGQGGSGKRRGCGKNINWRDRHGETMLHKVVTYGTVEEIEELIEQGADVNARDNAGSVLSCRRIPWHIVVTSCSFTVLYEAVELKNRRRLCIQIYTVSCVH